jgi:hypothetical protein
MGLSYTFLGTNTTKDSEVYTPLIVPNSLYGLGYEPPVSAAPNPNNSGGPTPFSVIRNHLKDNLDNNNNLTTTVNVLNDYMWTISPKTSKMGRNAEEYRNEGFRNVNDETPYIFLKEKYFLVNNLIAQALYTLSIFDGTPVKSLTDFFNSATDFVQKGLRTLGDKVNPVANNGSISGIEGVPGGEFSSADPNPNESGFFSATGTALANGVTTFNNNVDTLQTIFKKYNNPDLEPVLFPYQKLYFVGPTGFQYKIPYLNSRVLDVNNSFGESVENITGNLIDLINSGTGFTEVVAGTGKLLSQAGTAKIERAKHYQYPSEGPAIEVVFPLYNTSPASYEDVLNNYKLVLLLMYQNLPLRQDKIIVEPPVLYDVTIPGNRRAPYCYVSSLVVNYRGSTRLMDLDLGGISSTNKNVSIPAKLKTIVPDMYEIRMTLQPMIATTKNLLFATVTDNVVKATTQSFE